MAYTRLSDAIVPQIFGPYVLEKSIVTNRLINSGIVPVNPALSALLNGGGLTFNAPFWGDIVSSDIVWVPDDDATHLAVPEKITAKSQVAVRLARGKAWQAASLVAMLAGSDPLEAAAVMASEALQKFRQRSILSTIAGCVNATTATGLVTSVAAEDAGDVGFDTQFSPELLIDAMAVGGDMATADGAALVMHSRVYRSLLKANLVQSAPMNAQGIAWDNYLGFRIIVDDAVTERAGTTSGTVQTVYVIRPGGIQLGIGSPDVPVETERSALAGYTGGVETLVVRDEYAVQVSGFAYKGPAVIPTDDQLGNPANWELVIPAKAAGVSAISFNA